jgi:DnaJ-class molecular chaperone
MAVNDPYGTLGVEKTATAAEIRDAYRNLAKKYHPDLNPGSKAAEAKFKEISLAYETIGTPENRAKFDRGEEGPQEFTGHGPFYTRTQQRGPDGRSGRYSYSFADAFDEDLFAGFGIPPEDEVYRMDVELGDTVLGTEREITLPTGKRLRVKIPAGVVEGSRLRFAGQGAARARGGKPADVYVEVHVRPDARFQVNGNDLIYPLSVSLGDAVFGGETRVPTLEGQVMLKIPPHSNSRKRLKLRGKGLYDRARKARGDQIVVLEVTLPDPIDPELESALRQWQANRKGEVHERP